MSESSGVTEPASDFLESAYLAAFPKVEEAIRAGQFKSALDHYMRRGAGEGRLAEPRYLKALAALQSIRSITLQPPTSVARPGEVASGIDVLMVAPGHSCCVIGWVDDRQQSLDAVSLQLADGRCIRSTQIARCRRPDAEVAVGVAFGQLLGFWALFTAEFAMGALQGAAIVLHCGDIEAAHTASPKSMSAAALRDTIFEYFAGTSYFGSPVVESFIQMESGIGEGLMRHNKALSAEICARAYVERFGPQNRKFSASIVVCLYGRIEYFFLQAAFFSGAAGAMNYEFIYVCNSPELTEGLQREARIAARQYGTSITLVFLPDNAGFGAANNVAISCARSERVLILNPDVFPRDAGWAVGHADIVANLPASQTMLFGAPLFYDDGSLMHGGMYFEIDSGLSVKGTGFTRRDMLRVEHYGKGAPPDFEVYRGSSRVPAVTGAFISANRGWFEKLGGFSEEYVFGHYEDADLCLKSWQAGVPVWRHEIPMWHLEGKGSVRRATHEGGSMINRWHFTSTWLDVVVADFHGPTPSRIPL